MASELSSPVVRLLDAAINYHVDAFLATFTEEGVVDGWGREFAGAAEIQDGATESSSASMWSSQLRAVPLTMTTPS